MNVPTGEDDPYRFRILSLDGGGVRGAFTAGFLAAVEQRIGHTIGRHFDLVAGTSTGGIIAAAVAFGEPAARIEQFYLERGPIIFRRWWDRPTNWRIRRWGCWLRRQPSWLVNLFLRRRNLDHYWLWNTKYEATELRSALDEVFANRTLGQSSTRLVIPSVNLTVGQPKVFKTAHLPLLFVDHAYRVTDVLLATTAAPTFFPHAVIDQGSAYIDGGVWANNPSMVAVVEAMQIMERCSREVDPAFTFDSTHMLSIGTGSPKLHARPPGTKAGIHWWMSNKLLEVMSLSQSKGIDFQSRHILGDRYRRIEFDLPENGWSMDNASLVTDMVHIGRERGNAVAEELRDQFFKGDARPFVPYISAVAQPAPLADQPAAVPPTSPTSESTSSAARGFAGSEPVSGFRDVPCGSIGP